MNTHYELEPLSPDEAERWDEFIARFESRELFHRKVWLDYLAASRGVEIRQWAIQESGRRVGYFCGGVVEKGPFSVLGSPLKSWGTNFMGPVVSRELGIEGFLRAVDCLAQEEQLAMTELESRVIHDDILATAHYEAVSDSTFLVELTPQDPELMWKALDSTCRNRVRKAVQAKLTVEDTDDPVVADEFYDQYTDVMRRKALVPPYPRAYPQLLFHFLKGAGLLFALRVRHPDGHVLATGLFPHDDHTVYFWGGASLLEGRDLCPNEFLHWNAMRLAAARGLRLYNTCGTGQFKRKFGGAYTVTRRWHKSYWRTAHWARRGYELYFRNRQRLQGWCQRMPGGRQGA